MVNKFYVHVSKYSKLHSNLQTLNNLPSPVVRSTIGTCITIGMHITSRNTVYCTYMNFTYTCTPVDMYMCTHLYIQYVYIHVWYMKFTCNVVTSISLQICRFAQMVHRPGLELFCWWVALSKRAHWCIRHGRTVPKRTYLVLK